MFLPNITISPHSPKAASLPGTKLATQGRSFSMSRSPGQHCRLYCCVDKLPPICPLCLWYPAAAPRCSLRGLKELMCLPERIDAALRTRFGAGEKLPGEETRERRLHRAAWATVVALSRGTQTVAVSLKDLSGVHRCYWEAKS